MEIKKSDIRMVVTRDPEGPPPDAETDLVRAYERGEFLYLGVHAEVGVSTGDGTATFCSHGLWGVGVATRRDPYLGEVFEEQRNDLCALLTDIGIEVVDDLDMYAEKRSA